LGFRLPLAFGNRRPVGKLVASDWEDRGPPDERGAAAFLPVAAARRVRGADDGGSDITGGSSRRHQHQVGPSGLPGDQQCRWGRFFQ
jgi:hypothetical protein